MSEDVKSIGPEPEVYTPAVETFTTTSVAHAAAHPVTGRHDWSWHRDREKGGWYHIIAEGPAQEAKIESVTDAEFVAFERAARVGNRDLLRGKKLEQRLNALVLGRRTGLALTDWREGPVFTAKAIADATGTP